MLPAHMAHASIGAGGGGAPATCIIGHPSHSLGPLVRAAHRQPQAHPGSDPCASAGPPAEGGPALDASILPAGGARAGPVFYKRRAAVALPPRAPLPGRDAVPASAGFARVRRGRRDRDRAAPGVMWRGPSDEVCPGRAGGSGMLSCSDFRRGGCAACPSSVQADGMNMAQLGTIMYDRHMRRRLLS